MLLATLTSPWYELVVSGQNWWATWSNGGVRMQWFVRSDFREITGVRLGLPDEETGAYRWTWYCNPGSWGRSAWLPAWIPFAPVVAMTAAVWGIAYIPARRGGCAGCGYDLTGVVAEEGRLTCPECGRGSASRPPA